MRVVGRPRDERDGTGAQRGSLQLVAAALGCHVADGCEPQDAPTDAASERDSVFRYLGLVRFQVRRRHSERLGCVERTGAGDDRAGSGLVLRKQRSGGAETKAGNDAQGSTTTHDAQGSTVEYRGHTRQLY